MPRAISNQGEGLVKLQLWQSLPELLFTSVGDLGAADVQAPKIRQLDQMQQSTVGDIGVFEGQI